MPYIRLVACPHCGGPVEVVEVNCAIFRHGVFKSTGGQMNPHAPKHECDALFERGEIYGCGRPFRIVRHPEKEYEAVICDYI